MRILEMFLLSLVLTLVIETAVALIMGVRMPGLKVVWLVNLLTNPAVVYLSLLSAWFLAPNGRRAALVFLEAAAIAVEAFIYTKNLDWEALPDRTAAGKLAGGRPAPASLVLSLLLNAASYGMGELIEILIRRM